MRKIILFHQMILTISDIDWDFLCKNRFFTDDPLKEEIQAEFVSGTGITQNKPHLWKEAEKRFAEYIEDLREIQQMNVNHIARNLLTDEEKFNETT